MKTYYVTYIENGKRRNHGISLFPSHVFKFNQSDAKKEAEHLKKMVGVSDVKIVHALID